VVLVDFNDYIKIATYAWRHVENAFVKLTEHRSTFLNSSEVALRISEVTVG
jgi:hypothetical protein